MASATEIANMAISHLGTGKEIANIQTENSSEANACRRFYQTALDETLRDGTWPFATKFATLNLIEQNPTIEWLYSYQYPVDCKHAKRIVSGVPNESRQDRLPYKIVNVPTGRAIYSNQQNAQLEYTVAVDNPDLFPDDFKMALSFRLAHYIAPRLTKGDPFKMGDRAMRMYEFEINRAKATAFNEEQPDELPESEFVRFRD